MASVLDRQQGHLFPWVAVLFGAGIALYFALRWEPGGGLLALSAGAAAASLVAAARLPQARAPLIACAAVLMGFAWAGTETRMRAAPVLEFRYYGPVQGRLVDIDRAASGALRLTLDRVVLARLPPNQTPERVRVSLQGEGPHSAFDPGKTLILTAHLSPPPGPAEPGGFDFRRHAWFQKIGAVGYSRDPVLALTAPEGAVLRAWRARLGTRISAAMPDDTGAFAVALITGDRAGLDSDRVEALRASNLAHLLAISGLHMGMVSGGVFFLVRLLLAWPAGIYGWNARAGAAVVACIAAAGYLAISGNSVATERAFVMVAVALGAVLLGRRVLSLRAVAMAALIVLGLDPHALLGPGFQMSFAATTALVWVFGLLRGVSWTPQNAFLKAVFATAVSSAVAGAATAPFAMVHFNQLSQFGLLANLLAVPMMGVLVMPGAASGLLLMPLGAEATGFFLMDLGIQWIVMVAEWVAHLPGAVHQVPTPPAPVLGLIACTAVILFLWQGHGRWVAVVPALASVMLWTQHIRPDVLIAQDGRLVGVLTTDGRALSRDRTAGFIASVWLENDGTAQDQVEAARLWQGMGIRHVTGKRANAALTSCDGADLIVSDKPVTVDLDCLVLDAVALKDGPVSAKHTPDGWMLTTATDLSGTRLWTPRPVTEQRNRDQ